MHILKQSKSNLPRTIDSPKEDPKTPRRPALEGLHVKKGPPGVLGIWGEWVFIFRELGSTGNYLRGAREQAHNFGDIGSFANCKK